jgi:hypothetical protein
MIRRVCVTFDGTDWHYSLTSAQHQIQSIRTPLCGPFRFSAVNPVELIYQIPGVNNLWG